MECPKGSTPARSRTSSGGKRSSVSSASSTVRRIQEDMQAKRQLSALEERKAKDALALALTLATKKTEIEKTYEDERIERGRQLIFQESAARKAIIDLEEEEEDDELQRSCASLQLPQDSNFVENYVSSLEKMQSHAKKPAVELTTKEQDIFPAVMDTSKADFARILGDSIGTAMRRNEYTRTEKSRQNINMELPHFEGNPKDWLLFIAQYEETKKFGNYTDAENLVRLQRSLRGEARQRVSSLLLSPKNVDTIINVLRERYGRPEYIIEQLLSNLRSLKPLSMDDENSIIDFADDVRNVSCIIKSLDMLVYDQNPNLIHELVRKLPPALRIQWATSEKDKKNFSDLSRWLSSLASDLGCIARPKAILMQGDRRKFKQESVMSCRQVLQFETKSFCLFCEKAGHITKNCRSLLKQTFGNRIEWAKKNGICYRCVEKGHMINSCASQMRCEVAGCGRHHNTVFHRHQSSFVKSPTRNEEIRTSYVPEKTPSPEVNAVVKTPGTEVNTVEETPSPEVNAVVNARLRNKTVYLRVLPVKVTGPLKSINTFAFLDDGATVSMLNKEIAEEIGANGPVEALTWYGASDVKSHEPDSRKVSFKISGLHANDKEYFVRNARTVVGLNLKPHSVDVTSLKKKWRHLQSVPFESMENAVPTILIGMDNWSLGIPRDMAIGSNEGLVATKTLLGWVVHGTDTDIRQGEEHIHHIDSKDTCEQLERINKQLHETWSLEAFGVIKENEQLRSAADIQAERIMKETTKGISANRFETGLLWIDATEKLPPSYTSALRRLKSVERKLDRDSAYAKRYCDKMQHLLDMGYACNPAESSEKNQKSHFGVIKPKKPDNLRIVFDAASESCGRSLNSFLLSGPDLYNNLIGVLMKFRQYQFAFTDDIKEMFPQVNIRKEDAVAQKFLCRGMNRESVPGVYQMDAMIL